MAEFVKAHRVRLHDLLTQKLNPDLVRVCANLFLGILFGFIWFLLLYGRETLFPTHVNWIYIRGGDVLQHQLGWEWFRQEPWRLPLGRIEAYGFPFGTSVAFMDAIPLFAFPFKLLSPWLSANFQYLGLWEMTSVIGQMTVGIFLLQEFTRSNPLKIIGASLLVLSPPMIFRAFYHNSLTAHWILLAGIWFLILEHRHRLRWWAWPTLFAVTMLVHLYLLAMLLPIWAVSLYLYYRREKKALFVFLELALVIGLMGLLGYAIGYFGLPADDLIQGSFGNYSWNLNGFINPFGNASIFVHESTLNSTNLGEGFSYLGLGFILILPVAIVLFLKKENLQGKMHLIISIGLISLFFCLFALSNKAYLNTQLLWDFPISGFPAKLLSAFRSSGRFIWPVFYFITVFGVVSIVRNVPYPRVEYFLLFALFLQLADLQPLLTPRKITEPSQFQSQFESDFWQAAADANDHLVLIPTDEVPSHTGQHLALFARQNHLTFNWGYFARGQYRTIEKYANAIFDGLAAGKTDAGTIYLFWEPEKKELARKQLSSSMLLCDVDGYLAAFSLDNPITRTDIDLAQNCKAPTN